MAPEGVVLTHDAIVRRTANGEESLVPLTAVKLLGRHLLADVLAASAVASIVGVDAAAMTKAVEGFTGLEHALEPVAEIGGVRFVNDSKATNIEAARRAVESFGEGVVVVLGGRFKGGDFRDLLPPLVERHATVVSIGESRPLIREALGSAVALYEAEDMSSAVRRGVCLRVTRTDGRPGASLLELRHVPRLRGARASVQAGGEEATGGVEHDERAVGVRHDGHACRVEHDQRAVSVRHDAHACRVEHRRAAVSNLET